MLTTATQPAAADDPVVPTVLGTPQRLLVPSLPKVRSLGDLSGLLGALERRERPDAVLALKDLSMRDDGRIEVPGEGAFALTDWARRQLSEKLGIRWDRWFSSVTGAEGAAEVNLRLSRTTTSARLRLAEVVDEESGQGTPVLRAFVSPKYSPFSDAMIAGLLAEAFDGTEHDVHRISYTDMTVSYAVSIGEPFKINGDNRVGDLQGTVLVRNSGVGYASLNITAYLVRLICLDGMRVPVKDPVLLAAVHRGQSERAIREKLSENARRFGCILVDGAERLLSTRRMPIDNREATFLEILRRARVPKKQLPSLEKAYESEPEETVFGIAQAVTLAAQSFPAETRYELERATSAFVADHAVS